MDLLRAVMIGPQGTPYHDGLFFFDAHFPPSYPTIPPVSIQSLSVWYVIHFHIWIKKIVLMPLQVVHYHAGGLRLNPNLYACGKVCLSLLGTWQGKSCEKWNPAQSTMLQVLISIQALVLNEKPFYNEPGHERYANSAEGLEYALDYNDTAFQYSCRTMLYSLRKPPQVVFC
jgi:ubiquitin-conjugating enzyme E2 O